MYPTEDLRLRHFSDRRRDGGSALSEFVSFEGAQTEVRRFYFLISDLSSLPADMSIFPAEEQQRFPALDFRVFYFPNHNGVISSDMRRNNAATQLRHCILQNWDSLRRPAKAH